MAQIVQFPEALTFDDVLLVPADPRSCRRRPTRAPG